MRRQVSCLSLGICLLAGAWWAPARPADGGFAPYVASALPQRAAADFDADGRPDVAFIQAGRDGSRIVLALSGSSDAVALDMDAVSVATGDVDHDGDTDLVVATSLNRVVIWLNDGRGHFTEERPAPSRDLSPETNIVSAWPVGLAGVGPTVPQIMVPARRRETVVVAAPVRPPTVLPAVGLSCVSLPSLRGPPPSVTHT